MVDKSKPAMGLTWKSASKYEQGFLRVYKSECTVLHGNFLHAPEITCWTNGTLQYSLRLKVFSSNFSFLFGRFEGFKSFSTDSLHFSLEKLSIQR